MFARTTSSNPPPEVHPERRRFRVILGWLGLAAVALLVLGGCGGSDDDGGSSDSAGVVATADGDTLTVGELLDAEDRGESGTTVVVAAMLVDDGTGLRMCESLAESYPPQCGGRSVEVMNPGAIEVEFTEDGGVRWAETPIELFGWMEGDTFYVS